MNKPIHTALIITATAGALMTGVIVPHTSQDEQLAAVRNDLDVRIAEATAGARARAATLAQLPRIGWAVATDEKTFMDLTPEELGFRTQAGESIEITQVTLSDGRAHTLLRLPPAASARPPLTAVGTQVITDGTGLRVAAVVAIEPRRLATELAAAVAVIVTVDVATLGKRLGAQGLGARVKTPGGSVSIGGVEVPPERYTTRLPLRNAAGGDPVTLLAYAPGASKRRPVVSAILWALALAVGARLFLRRARDKRVAPLVTAHGASRLHFAAETTTSSHRGPTMPPPVAHDALELNQSDDESDITLNGQESQEERQGRQAEQVQQHVRRQARSDQGGPSHEMSVDVVLTDSVTLPNAAFETASQSEGKNDVSHDGNRGGKRDNKNNGISDDELDAVFQIDGKLVAEYSALFREFIRLRQTCGEPTASVHEDHFIRVLAKKRAAIIAEQAVKDVTFRLAFDNGKAGVRYRPVA